MSGLAGWYAEYAQVMVPAAFVAGAALMYPLARRDRAEQRAQAKSPAVAGYGRAEVPPAGPVVEVAPEPLPDPHADRKMIDLGQAWVVDRLADLRERASAAGRDRSEGWDAPGALDELRAVTQAAGRHAVDEVTP